MYAVAACTGTDWTMFRDVEVIVERAVHLGCGCWRVETSRPGPADGPLVSGMHQLVQRCGFHAANHAGYGDEWTRVDLDRPLSGDAR